MYFLITQIHKFGHQKNISDVIEGKDNAENKMDRVISAAILKNGNLGTFPKDIFGKLFSFSPVEYMS